MICYTNPKKKDRSFIPVIIAFTVMAVITAGIGLKTSASSALFISEVCPHNDDVIYDSVGFHHDLIKISNSSSAPIDLNGYGLSDDATQLGKFRFPDVLLEAGDSITVWADEKTVFGDGFSDDEALFTGFNLNDHDFLYLTDPDDRVIDSLRIPQMKRDQSYLREYAGDKGIKGTPTDMETEVCEISESVLPPSISVPSGFYEQPFFLAMEAGRDSIYYTVDGSSPYTSGVKYEGEVPIVDRSMLDNYYSNLGPVSVIYDHYTPAGPVSKASVIRAVSKRDDGTFSKETDAVYFVGEEIRGICNGSYTLSIISDPQGLFSGRNGIYVTGNVWDMNKDRFSDEEADLHEVPVNYNMRGSDWRREAAVTLFDAAGFVLYDEDALISIRGGYSRSEIQKGFNIRPAKAGQKVFYGLFEDNGEIIALRTGSETDVYSTNFRDAVNNRIALNLNVAAQESHCCQVYLDGEYWGCYNLQEHLDETFIAARYKVPAEGVNLIRFNGTPYAESGLEEDIAQYNEVKDYADSHDLGKDEYFDEFCKMVDINSLIDYYCAQLFFANGDAYIYNNAMWRMRKTGSGTYEDGKWRFLLFDLDNTDGYNMADGAEAAAVDPFEEMTWIMSDQFYPNLSRSSKFKKMLRDRMQQLLADDFSYERISPILDEFEAQYTKAMVLSVQRFNDPDFSQEQYAENVQVVRDFFRERSSYVSKYLLEHTGD